MMMMQSNKEKKGSGDEQWLRQWNEVRYVNDSKHMDQLWCESASQRAAENAHRYQATTNEEERKLTIHEYENDVKRARIVLGSVDRDRQKLKQQLNEPKYNSTRRQTIEQAIRNTDKPWLTAYMREKLEYNNLEKLYQPQPTTVAYDDDDSDDV
jgi:hypothetical protein